MSALSLPKLRIRRRRRPPRYTRSDKALIILLSAAMIVLCYEFASTGRLGAMIGAAGSASAIQGVIRRANRDLFGALRALLLALALVWTATTMSFVGQ